MHEGQIPPEVLRALMRAVQAVRDRDGDEGLEGAVFVVQAPNPRDRLFHMLAEGLEQGDQFRDIFGVPLNTPDDILEALKQDGRVSVVQTLELEPELVDLL